MTRAFRRRMRGLLWSALVSIACIPSINAAQASTSASRTTALPTLCGWLDNPTPGNVELLDRDGRWEIAMQGGHQAEGNLPAFTSARWVRTGHGSAGYGCVCIKARVDRDERKILQMVQARSMPLQTCRKDPAIKGEEPFNPLK